MAWYRSRYVQLLEAEVARLQERERLLLNRVMPRLGYEALDEKPKSLPTAKKQHRPSWGQWAAKKMRDALKNDPREIVLPRPDRKEADGKPSTAA